MFGRTAQTSQEGVSGIPGGSDRWMTYQEAAALFGGTPDAIRVRAHRSHWRRQRGNDGKILVLVPADPSEHSHPLAPVRSPVRSGVRTGERTPERTGGQHGQGEELRLALELLRDQAAEQRWERRSAEERERALRAEVQSLHGRVAEAEAAALEGWRTAAELARQQKASLGAQRSVQASEPSPRKRGWLVRLFG